MRNLLKTVLGAMALAVASLANPASATTFLFDFDGNNQDVTPSTTYLDFSAKTGNETLSVRASGYSIKSGYIWNSGIGAYSGGLGVTSDWENGKSGTHTIDNQNQQDFVLLQFSKAVVLTQIETNAYAVGGSTDSDATVGGGNSATPVNWNGEKVSALNILLKSEYTYSGNSTNVKRDIKSTGTASNLWIVAASFANKDGFDGFKLSGASVITPVPEPATWMTMILGFGVVGTAIRRRKAADRASALATA